MEKDFFTYDKKEFLPHTEKRKIQEGTLPRQNPSGLDDFVVSSG
jgi:DNA polymerase IIIc chi subunit